MDNITHCLQAHMNVLLFVLIKCQTKLFLVFRYTDNLSIQGSLSGETREYFPILCPNIAPTIDQREILLSLGILRYHEKYITKNDYIQYNFNSWFYKKGNIFWNNISLSYWIAKICHLYKKWNFLQQHEIGFGYPCVVLCSLVSQVISRMCIYIFPQSRKSLFTRIKVLTLQLLTTLIQRS